MAGRQNPRAVGDIFAAPARVRAAVQARLGVSEHRSGHVGIEALDARPVQGDDERQEILEFLVEGRILPADPLQYHGGVLLFLVAVVRENRLERGVLAGVDPLVVPVHRLQLFHQRDDCPVHVPRLFAELFQRFVIAFVCHMYLLLAVQIP